MLTLKTGEIFGVAKYLKHEKQRENRNVYLSNAPDNWVRIILFVDSQIYSDFDSAKSRMKINPYPANVDNMASSYTR